VSTPSFADPLPLAVPSVTTPATRVALSAALLGAACLLGLIEAALPPMLPLPWLKIGLANAAVVVALATGGWRLAGTVSVGRVIVLSLVTGTLAGPTFLLAFAGAAASLVAMCALAAFGERFSPVGWSAAGSVAHVVVQLALAAALVRAPDIMRLASVSVLIALILGVLIGSLARSVVLRLPRIA